jgi:hypothetical protein
MIPPWLMTCSCGFVTAAETLEELVILVELHKRQTSPGPLHAVSIKGRLFDVPAPSAPRSQPAA